MSGLLLISMNAENSRKDGRAGGKWLMVELVLHDQLKTSAPSLQLAKQLAIIIY